MVHDVSVIVDAIVKIHPYVVNKTIKSKLTKVKNKLLKYQENDKPTSDTSDSEAYMETDHQDN